VSGTIVIMVLGNLIIYACGVPWLMASLGLPLTVALESGLWPFVIGDALKLALAAGLLPLTWRLVGRHD
jgi:biotin transport system substrate-specific component